MWNGWSGVNSRSTLTFTFLVAFDEAVGVSTEDGVHGIGERRSHDSLTESQRCNTDGSKNDGGDKVSGAGSTKEISSPNSSISPKATDLVMVSLISSSSARRAKLLVERAAIA